MAEPGLRDWRPSVPADAAGWLGAAAEPWWIAGGWAIELFLGRVTRPHGDLDVGCFRADLAGIRARLGGWVVCAAKDGRLTRLGPAEVPGAEVHSLWCRPRAADRWWLELMLDERSGSDWRFRRCPRVRRGLGELTLETADGLRYLRPELALLYKAKHRRPVDEADLANTLPHLDPFARSWLRDALATWQPGHPWIAALGD